MWLQITLLIVISLRISYAGYDCIPNCNCEFRGILRADCGDANYTAIPQPDFTYALEALDVQNNGIEVLRDGEFLRLNYLEELDLHGNRIHTIEDGAFDGLGSLKMLDLSRNRLSSIPSTELSKLAWHLGELSIAENMFHDLPGGISALTSLKRIDFSGNEFISDIPPGILPPFLTDLHMSSTGIRHMKRSMLANQTGLRLLEFGKAKGHEPVVFEENFFDRFPSLEYVELSGHSLRRLQQNTFSRLTNLEALILINCDLRSFPELYTLEEGSASGTYFNETNTSTIHQNLDITWHNNKLTTLDLSHNQNIRIDSGNTQFPPSLTDLRLGYTDIPLVDKDLFEGATKIERLDLQFSNIREIASDSFIHMRNLSEIWLSGNSMEEVPQLPGSLIVLDCHSTGIKNLTKEPFAKLHNIVEANFSNSQIESVLDFTFGHMVSLRKLDLSSNKIATLSKDTLAIGIFHSPHEEAADTAIRKSSLSDLNLSNGLISKIGERAFQTHATLKRLYLQMNYLTEIQQGVFNGLSELSVLNLNDNAIKDVAPQAFEDLTSLQILFLENNKIEVIFSDLFADLQSLRQLHLGGNNIKIFHPTSISSLEYVDISKNQLSEFPQVGGENVHEMDVSMNPIDSIDPTVIHFLIRLQVLNISHCNLKHVDYGVFANSQGLRTVDFTGNGITNFLDRRLPHLKELFMGDNDIKSVDSVSFLEAVTPKIEILDLSYNPIKYIDGAFFHGANNLQTLNLTGSKLICDCNLAPLVKWMRNSSKIRGKIDHYACGDSSEPVVNAIDNLDCYSHEDVEMNRATMYIALCVALVLIAMILLVLTWCLCKKIRKRSSRDVVGLGGGVTMVQANNSSCRCCCFGSGYTRSRGRFESEESRDLVEHVTSPVDKDAPIPL